jgi:hypothetical protein
MQNLSVIKIVSCLMFVAVFFPNHLAAQWSGSSLNGNSYRNGNVGIGLSSPSALLHIKTLTQQRYNIDGTITFMTAPNIRLEENGGSSSYWDITSGISLDFSSGTNTANMSSRMSISSGTFHYKGSTTKLGVNENELTLGSQNAPSSNLGQFIAFGANPLSGGWSFTGNSSNNGGAIIQGDDNGNLFFITRSISGSNTMTASQTAANVRMRMHGDGKISIGTGNRPLETNENGDDYLLFVKGGTLSEEVAVKTGWADYVFTTDYNLLSLEKVETHISEKGHLHNTPSAADLNGTVNLGDATVNQQEKIEEIYLHLIEMNKRMKALEKENEALKMEIENLKQ